MTQATHHLAAAVRKMVEDMLHDAVHDHVVGNVTATGDDLTVHVLATGQMLHDDELVMTQNAAAYDNRVGIAVGDTVLLRRDRSGGDHVWYLFDVVSDNDPGA